MNHSSSSHFENLYLSLRPFPNLIFDIVRCERLISLTVTLLGTINRHDILLPYVIYRCVCFVFSFKNRWLMTALHSGRLSTKSLDLSICLLCISSQEPLVHENFSPRQTI